jgi:hypothetical protein
MRVKIKYERPGDQKSSSELYGTMSNGKSDTKRTTHRALCDESVSTVGVLEWLMFAFKFE